MEPGRTPPGQVPALNTGPGDPTSPTHLTPLTISNTINPNITQVQGLLDLTRPVLVVWVEMVVVVVTQSGCPGQYPVLVFTGRGRGQAGASHRHLSTNTQTLTVRPVRSVNTTLQCIQIRLNI